MAWEHPDVHRTRIVLWIELNKNISRLGGFVSTMINYSLIAVLTLVLIDQRNKCDKKKQSLAFQSNFLMALLEDSGRCLALEDEGGGVINLCSPTSPYFTCWLHSDHHIDSTYNNWNGQTNKQYTRFTIPCHQYKYKPCLSFASASSKSI